MPSAKRGCDKKKGRRKGLQIWWGRILNLSRGISFGYSERVKFCLSLVGINPPVPIRSYGPGRERLTPDSAVRFSIPVVELEFFSFRAIEHKDICTPDFNRKTMFKVRESTI